MNTYKIQLKHDTGYYSITTKAKDSVSAIDIICQTEGCPKHAVLSCTEILSKRTYLFFETKENRNEALSIITAMNIEFTYNRVHDRKHSCWISFKPELILDKCLDLYLHGTFKTAFSSFSI